MKEFNLDGNLYVITTNAYALCTAFTRTVLIVQAKALHIHQAKDRHFV